MVTVLGDTTLTERGNILEVNLIELLVEWVAASSIAEFGLVTIKDPGNRVTSKAIEDSEGRIQIGEDGPTSSLDTSTGSITVTIRETMGESAAKTKQDQSAPQAP